MSQLFAKNFSKQCLLSVLCGVLYIQHKKIDQKHEVESLDKTTKMIKQYFSKSQQMLISSNEECKNALNKVSRQNGGIWNSSSANCVLASKACDYSFVQELGKNANLKTKDYNNVQHLNIDNGIDKTNKNKDVLDVIKDMAHNEYSIENDKSMLADKMKEALEKQSIVLNKSKVNQAEATVKKTPVNDGPQIN